MKYLILGSPFTTSFSKYRGTYREGPYYVEGLGDEHPANKAFLQIVRKGEVSGMTNDISVARSMIEVYKSLDPPQNFELVIASTDPTIGIPNAKLLGFDVSHEFWYSLIESFFDQELDFATQTSEGDVIFDLMPLIELVSKYFKDKLKKNWLFQDIDDAKFFMDCMMSLQKIRKHLWEHDDVLFEIVGLWKVD